jgi:hypothetical protein
MSEFVRVSSNIYGEIIKGVSEELRQRVEADAQKLVPGLSYHEGDLRAAVESVFNKRYGSTNHEREIETVVAHFLEKGITIHDAAETIEISIELHLDESETQEQETRRVEHATSSKKRNGR